STKLWETHPNAMQLAIKKHNDIMRRYLRQVGGYEVKTEGDAFMVSFRNPVSALEWCLAIQTELMKLDWPAEILSTVEGGEIWDHENPIEGAPMVGTCLFRGLSVRMGIHVGTPLYERDPITSRMDYFGPMVNRSSRICTSSQGGQILVSGEVLKEIRRIIFLNSVLNDVDLNEFNNGVDLIESILRNGKSFDVRDLEVDKIKRFVPCVWLLGVVKLKGLETPETIYPRSVVGRHKRLLGEIKLDNFMPSELLKFESSSARTENSVISQSIFDNIVSKLISKLRDISKRLEILIQNEDSLSLVKQSKNHKREKHDSVDSEFAESIVIMDKLVTKIENSISLLHLTQMKPFTETLQTVEKLPQNDITYFMDSLEKLIAEFRNNES
ncbi:cysteinyl-tRNA synthetase, partial [Nowakowskiella sp. JEL0078]